MKHDKYFFLPINNYIYVRQKRARSNVSCRYYYLLFFRPSNSYNKTSNMQKTKTKQSLIIQEQINA